MPTGRTRTNVDPPFSGSIIYIPSGAETTYYGGNYINKCVDTIGGYPDPYPMFIDHYGLRKPGTISGQPLSFPIYRFKDYPMDNQGAYPSWHLPVSGIPTNDAALAQMEARTNPSRPEVAMPNFIFELKDIPELLHLKGLEFEKEPRFINLSRVPKHKNSVAERYFGWNLLFQDLGRLLNFTDQVNRRVKELKALYTKRGLRRVRTVFTGQAAQTSGLQVFQSFNAWVDGWIETHTSVKTWATCKWQPDYPDIPSADELLWTARRVVHGWDFSSNGIGSILWEAVPWSWLGDYMSDVGDFFNAHRNAVGATAIDGCVMNHTVTSSTMKFNSISAGFTASPSAYAIDSKYRELSLAGLSVNLPFLGSRQLVTLLGITANLSPK